LLIFTVINGSYGGCKYPGCVPRPIKRQRVRGQIRRRGNSLQVVVYAGLDPLTGKRVYLRGSTTDEARDHVWSHA
jgi:hypothetical protein